VTLTPLDGVGSRRAKPGFAARLTPLAAAGYPLGAWPYVEYCPARLTLAVFASGAPGT